MAETRKRKIHKNDRHQAADDHQKQLSKKDRSTTRIILLVAVLGISLAILVYGFIPSRYTGPKHQHSERAAEKASKAKVAPLEDSDVATGEANTTCKELTDQARAIIATVKTGEKVELALDMLATCIMQKPNSSAARWNLAAALLQLNRINEALPFIDEALTIDPNNSLYLHNAGLLFARLELYREAILCLEKYLEVALRIVKWESLLAELSILREDDWQFLYEADDVLLVLEHLLNSYLQESALIKAGYLYRIFIGLKGPDNVPELVKAFALYSFSVGDINTGISYLQLEMEQAYVQSGYGDRSRAHDVISTHALRLLTHGINGLILSMVRNLLKSGQAALDELIYHCELDEVHIDLATPISQSTVRDIFVRCMVTQNIIPQLLQNGAIVHVENIFGWPPLLQVIPLNSTDILHQVLSARADVQSRTGLGLTALHVAAMTGSTEVVEMLVQAGLKGSSLDSFNRSALDVACYLRWPSSMIARSLKTQLPFGCPPPPLYLPPSKGFQNGGWLPSAAKLPKELTEEQCDIDVIGYTSSADELLLDYLSIQRPVLIRNATNRNSLKDLFYHWQREHIIERYGDLTFHEVLVPYARAFGANDTITTLRNFVDKLKKVNKQQQQATDVLDLAPPTYIFESLPNNSAILEHFEMPSVLDPALGIITREVQFYVGGALSGAPVHYHSSAWNVLVYGQKRWFIFPPHQSFYSKQHVWEWWKTRNRPQALECVQHPGDMIVLPDMWGHAVINLRESVGLASEFIYGSSEFSL